MNCVFLLGKVEKRSFRPYFEKDIKKRLSIPREKYGKQKTKKTLVA